MNSTYTSTVGNPSVTVAARDDSKYGITVVRLFVLAIGVVVLTFGMLGIKHTESDVVLPVVVQAIPAAPSSS